MNALKIIAMPTSLADRVRATLADDFGNRLSPQIDDGTGPCRHCLRYALPGERLLLFSYKPFEQPGPYQEVGPVFVHADTCDHFEGDGIFPVDFNSRPLVLRPYDARNHIQDGQTYAPAGEAESTAQALLANPDVAYVHARSRASGCFMFKIERASRAPSVVG